MKMNDIVKEFVAKFVGKNVVRNLIILTAIFGLIGGANAGEIITQLNLTGSINGDPLSGSGTLIYNTGTGMSSGAIQFSAVPRDWSPLSVSGGSILCFLCTHKCTPHKGAINLDQLTGGNWAGVGINSPREPEGNIVGNMTQTVVLNKVPGRDNLFIADENISGWYTGPVNLVSSAGYRMLLHQLGPGEVEGTYTQRIDGTNSTYIINSVRRLYTYTGSGVLPFDEISTFRVTHVEFNRSTNVLTLEGVGCYDPFPELPKVTFDMPASVVLGENIEVRGTANAGDYIDIAIEDYIVKQSIPIAEDGTFEEDLPTPDTRGTGAQGSIRVEAFIRSVDELPLSGDVSGIEEDGSISILLTSRGLTAEISVPIVAKEDSFYVEGTAEGSDFVDILTIAPKGGGGKGIDPTSVTDVPGITHDSFAVSDIDYTFSKKLDVDDDADTGKYIIVVLSPGCDGRYNGLNDDELLGSGFETTYGAISTLRSKTQEQIMSILEDATIDEAGSDDLMWVGDIKVETPFVRLDPIADVGIGEPLVITGTTNREKGYPIVITVEGPLELTPATVKVEDGTFNATIDTTDAEVGTYTVKADDGDGHTDDATVEILETAPAPTPKEQAFEAIFAIAGLLAVAYFVLKRRK